jgi:hypothetical protein
MILTRCWAPALLLLLFAAQVPGANAQDCLAPKQKTVTIRNTQNQPAKVYINFGADSAFNSNDLSFCDPQTKTPLNCQFTMPALSPQAIPNPAFKYINMTVSFNQPVACGSTKAEMVVNNPNFCDVFDVSVVDGFNEKIQLELDSRPVGQVVTLGPPVGQLGNQNVFGVFPFGCTICAGILNPPCGDAGPRECHAGTESNPQPVCQFQVNQPNGDVQIILLPPSFSMPPPPPTTKTPDSTPISR